MIRENKLEEYRFQLGQSIGELFEWEDILYLQQFKIYSGKIKKS